MKFILALIFATLLVSCEGYKTGFGLSSEVDGKPVTINFSVEKTGKTAKDVTPIQPD